MQNATNATLRQIVEAFLQLSNRRICTFDVRQRQTDTRCTFDQYAVVDISEHCRQFFELDSLRTARTRCTSARAGAGSRRSSCCWRWRCLLLLRQLMSRTRCQCNRRTSLRSGSGPRR